MTIRELVVKLGIKTDPKGFQRAQAGITAMRNSALSLGRVFMTGALAYGFKRMIDVASDIEETANKFGAVFGEAGSNVQTQLDAISKRTGATNMQLQEMSSNIGALIKPALGSAEAAGQMATSVAELALDISSFNNVTSEDALIALRSGLIGSAEPLQRFGVDVRVAALEQEALAQGIQTSVKDMTEGQRVALRYAAIQKQLGMQGATGDATRTAKDFANASRNLWGALKEIVGVIMGFLLPAVTKLVNKSRVIVDSMRSWFKENKALVQQRVDKFIERFGRVVSAVATFVGRVIDATSEWYGRLGDVGKTLIKIGAVVAGLAIALLLPGAPIILLLALIGLLIEDFETWRKGGDSVIGDIIAWFKYLGDVIKSEVLTAFDALKAKLKSVSESVSNWADDNKQAIRAVTSAIGGLAFAVGVKLVTAHGAAWIATAKYLMFAIKYYAVTGASALKAGLLAQGAGLKAALAWATAAAPMLAIIALASLIIFIFQDIYRMLTGQESFFKTLVDGFWKLVDELGGVQAAIKDMLAYAYEYWLKFFGASEKTAKRWAGIIASIVTKALDILTKPLQLVIKAGGFVLEKVGDLGEYGKELFGVGTPETPTGAATVTKPVQRITAQPGARPAPTIVNRNRSEYNIEVHSQPGMSEERLTDLFTEALREEEAKKNRQLSYDFATEAP